MGEWLTDEDRFKIFILSEYQKLFETGLPASNPPTDHDNFPCSFFSEEEKVCLSAPVTEEEIR